MSVFIFRVLLGQDFFSLSPSILWWCTNNSWASSACSVPYCLPLYFLLPYVHSYFHSFFGYLRISQIIIDIAYLPFQCKLWLLMLLLWVPVLLLNTKVSSPHIRWGPAHCLVSFITACFLVDFLLLFLQLFVISYEEELRKGQSIFCMPHTNVVCLRYSVFLVFRFFLLLLLLANVWGKERTERRDEKRERSRKERRKEERNSEKNP